MKKERTNRWKYTTDRGHGFVLVDFSNIIRPGSNIFAWEKKHDWKEYKLKEIIKSIKAMQLKNIEKKA